MLDARGTDSTDYVMIRFLTPSFYQSRHHSIADAIIRLLTPDLMIVGKTLIFPQFQEVARVIDEMKLIGRLKGLYE